MPTKRASLAGVAAIAMAASGCGSDAAAPSETTLDQVAGIEIASSLISEIITIGFSALAGGGADGGSALHANTAAMVPVSQTVPCDGGGNITVQGSYTNDFGSTGTGTSAFDLSQTPNDCVLTTSRGAYTVNGNPQFSVAATLTVTDWNPGVFHIEYDGGFRWTGAGGSGSCDIQLTYNFDYANSTFTGSGHMCGYPLNFDQTG